MCVFLCVCLCVCVWHHTHSQFTTKPIDKCSYSDAVRKVNRSETICILTKHKGKEKRRVKKENCCLRSKEGKKKREASVRCCESSLSSPLWEWRPLWWWWWWWWWWCTLPKPPHHQPSPTQGKVRCLNNVSCYIVEISYFLWCIFFFMI